MNRAVCTICKDYLICVNCVSCPCGHTVHHECIQELQNEVKELKQKVTVRDTSILRHFRTLQNELKVKDGETKTVNNLLDNALVTNDPLEKQLSYCEKFKSDYKKLKLELGNKKLKLELENLQEKELSYRNIQALLDTERHDIDTTIKNFAGNPDSFNQIVTSYVLLKKEFNHLKESKRVIESDRKTYRKKAEAASREAYELKEQLKTVTKDVESLTKINGSLTEKMTKSTPRENAIKRLLRESPDPIDLKKQCLTSNTNEAADECLFESLFDESLFEDNAKAEHKSVDENCDRCEKVDSGYGGGSCNDDCVEDLDSDAEEAIKIADEFGLHYVATTSSTSDRQSTKTTKMKSSFVSNKSPTRTLQSNTNSNLPHFRQGFNGMGGQSKTLIIPKRTGSYVKPLPSNNAKKSGLGFMKIPKNNSKITKFVVSNSKFTSSIQLSP